MLTVVEDIATVATGAGGAVDSPHPIPNASNAAAARMSVRVDTGLWWERKKGNEMAGKPSSLMVGQASFNGLYYPVSTQSEKGTMWREFKGFILRENVLALAIAVVIGAAIGKVVTAVVDDFIMPIVGAVTPGGEWQKATFDVGSIKFGVGDFLSNLLNFLIIAFVVWRISKAFIPPAPAVTGPVTKQCPFCMMNIDPKASRCPHCTSQVSGSGATPQLAGG
jgi:large conductance mechanosensitive channel